MGGKGSQQFYVNFTFKKETKLGEGDYFFWRHFSLGGGDTLIKITYKPSLDLSEASL